MRKLKFVSSLLVCVLLFNVDYSSAQVSISLVSTSNMDIYSLNEEPTTNNMGLHSPTLEITPSEELKRLELDFDSNVAEDFGLYQNPYSNSIKIKSTNNVAYNNVQFSNVKTGQVEHKFEITNNEIDLTNVKTGNYMIIMTDNGNNIYSEVISIQN